jgi:ABC-type multidrug transport system fused ATPase/permease subunit
VDRGGYVGLTVVAGVLGFFDDFLANWIGERFLLDLRTRVLRPPAGLSLDFFDRRGLGDLISRLTGDIASIEAFVPLRRDGRDLLHPPDRLLSAALFYLQWDLALISLVVAPLFWLAAKRFSRLIKIASREKRRRSGSISSVAEESLSNAALVQAYGQETAEVERFHRENEGSYHAEMASVRLKALYSPLIDLIELSGALLVIGLGTWELSGPPDARRPARLHDLPDQLYSPVRGMSRLINRIHSASASAERIIEMLDQKPSVVESSRAVGLGAPRAGWSSTTSLPLSGDRRNAVSGVSVSVEPGEVLALVGPSGAGKSTLAKLLLRFYDPHFGRILLDGEDLRGLMLGSVRDNVALLLQETLVFDGTIYENIAYGRRGATCDQVEAAALAADADDFISALPDGYDTEIGQKGRRAVGRAASADRDRQGDGPRRPGADPGRADDRSRRRVGEPDHGAAEAVMGGRTTIVISTTW